MSGLENSSSKAMPTQCRHACFTVNNWTDETIKMLTEYQMIPANKCNYICWGQEVGESNTPHLQGYVQWTKPTRWASLAKKWKAHMENAMGSSVDARDYCMKDGTFVEFGEFRDIAALVKAGNVKGGDVRGDQVAAMWASAKQAAMEGRMDDIPAELYCKYVKNFEYIRQQAQARPDDLDGDLKRKNIWIHGPPGTGKSRLARMLMNPAEMYLKPRNKWWDSYRGEDFVLFEEPGKKDAEWLGEFLKIWADRYAFQGEVKGSSRMIRPKYFLVTSNYSIEDIFGEDRMMMEAVQRRFQSWILPYGSPTNPAWPVPKLENERDRMLKWLDLMPEVEVIAAPSIDNGALVLAALREKKARQEEEADELLNI